MERPINTKEAPSADRPVVRPRVRILNLRLLVETLIVAAIVGPAIYFWYSDQTNRTAEAMLKRGEELVKEKDDAAAAKYYFQYLKLNPGNADVQVRLAETFDRAAREAAGKVRSVEYYYQDWNGAVGEATRLAPTTGRIADRTAAVRSGRGRGT